MEASQNPHLGVDWRQTSLQIALEETAEAMEEMKKGDQKLNWKLPEALADTA